MRLYCQDSDYVFILDKKQKQLRDQDFPPLPAGRGTEVISGFFYQDLSFLGQELKAQEVIVTHTAWVWELKVPPVPVVPGCRGAAEGATHGCWIADGFGHVITDGSAAFSREGFRVPRAV